MGYNHILTNPLYIVLYTNSCLDLSLFFCLISQLCLQMCLQAILRTALQRSIESPQQPHAFPELRTRQPGEYGFIIQLTIYYPNPIRTCIFLVCI